MASHKKKDRAKQLAKARQRRAKRLQRRGHSEPVVIVTPPGMEKMSDVLEEFIEPYLDQTSTPDSWKKLLSLGIVAWNAALTSGPDREDLLQIALKAMPAEDRDFFRAFLLELVDRKEKHFADNTRFILNFELFYDPAGNPQLNVLSTLPTEARH